MENFLNEFLAFVDKGTDWKENNETTNSQVINHFIANNDNLIRELVDKLCDGKESADELSNCNKPHVSGSASTSPLDNLGSSKSDAFTKRHYR